MTEWRRRAAWRARPPSLCTAVVRYVRAMYKQYSSRDLVFVTVKTHISQGRFGNPRSQSPYLLFLHLVFFSDLWLINVWRNALTRFCILNLKIHLEREKEREIERETGRLIMHLCLFLWFALSNYFTFTMVNRCKIDFF
jgi:hypothetical protein